MAKFRSNQLWETRQAVMQVVAAAILVMTITGGVVSWGVARAGDLKDAVEGLEKVTENVKLFDGKINDAVEGLAEVTENVKLFDGKINDAVEGLAEVTENVKLFDGKINDAVEGLAEVTENVESFDGRINVIVVELTGLKQSNNELHEVIRILICQNENPPAGIDCSPTMEQ